MKIIIDIPEERFKDIQRIASVQLRGRFDTVEQIIAKGTPYDIDWDYPVNTNSYVVESIDNAPTIIGADKEE